MTPVTDRLRHQIALAGPVTIAQYMAEANAYYYATRDPLGAAGDFTTAPEISQMFGELAGLALAETWARAGRPDVHYVELGPGRGTLAADALRAMRAAGLVPTVELVETSPALREAQKSRVPHARWHDDLATLPDEGPLLVLANEFFDALPVHQLVRTESGWRELMVTFEEGRFHRIPGPLYPSPVGRGRGPFGEAGWEGEGTRPPPPDAPLGTIVETSPVSTAIVRELARRLVQQGGCALIVDYGPPLSGTGDTLQAVSAHAFADPWIDPGSRDLTAHVDFQALGLAAAAEGVEARGPVGQGPWLETLGIAQRTASLCRAAPARAEEIEAARNRLVSPQAMGALFKLLALVAPGWPAPEGVA